MSNQEGYPAVSTAPKAGSEPFTDGDQSVGRTLLDFWRWSGSDLLSNASRGVLAEYVVAQALGLADGVRAEWDAYDLVTASGLKVEVKSAAYLQSWFHRKLSRITFSIRPSRAWSAETNELASESKRQADVYVFCVLAHNDKATVDPLNLRQWRFYVLPTQVLDEQCSTQKQISLASLLKLNPVEADFSRLGAAVASFEGGSRSAR